MINDQAWLEFRPCRSAARRSSTRGLSSAASAANAAMDHVRDWIHGTREAIG
jgi:malate dehydrogenase